MTAAIWRAHLRLTVRSWGFWLVTLGALILVYIAVRDGSLSRMFGNFNEMAAPFFYLGQMLLTTAAAQRERQDRVDELVEAMAYGVNRWVLVRFLLHYTVWLAVSAVLWAAGGVLVALAGHPLDLGLLALNWAVVAPVTLAFTTGIAFTVGALVQRSVLAYFLIVAVWITGPFTIILLSKNGGTPPMPLGEYFASGRAFPLTATGYFINGGLLLYNRLFALGAAGAAVSLLLWLMGRRRRVAVAAAIPVLLLSLLLTAGAAAAEYGIWSGRQEAHDAEVAAMLADREKLKPAPGPAREQPLRADRYRLDVALEPQAHRLSASASFDVTNASKSPLPAIELTLRDTFAVQGVTDAAGKALPFTREYDRLIIEGPLAPGESRRLEVKWSGEVWHWRMENGPALAAHIAPESILLPVGYGWYPLPGRLTLRQELRFCQGEKCGPSSLLDEAVRHQPASFELSVSGTALNLIHNAGPSTAGLYLVGTPFEVARLGKINVAVAPINRVQGERMAREIAESMDYYGSLVPNDARVLNLVEVHDSTFYGQPWGIGASPTNETMLMKNREIGRFWDGYFTDTYARALLQMWWPERGDDFFQSNLYNAAMLYMGSLRSPGRVPPDGQILDLFKAMEAAGGKDAVVAVLRDMHALLPQGGPKFQQFEASVRLHAGSTPDLGALLGKIKRPK